MSHIPYNPERVREWSASWESRRLQQQRPGPVKPLPDMTMMVALQEHVTAERERQHGIGYTVGEWGQYCERRVTTNARHAKRLAGWPSGEWQGIKVGG